MNKRCYVGHAFAVDIILGIIRVLYYTFSSNLTTHRISRFSALDHRNQLAVL